MKKINIAVILSLTFITLAIITGCYKTVENNDKDQQTTLNNSYAILATLDSINNVTLTFDINALEDSLLISDFLEIYSIDVSYMETQSQYHSYFTIIGTDLNNVPTAIQYELLRNGHNLYLIPSQVEVVGTIHSCLGAPCTYPCEFERNSNGNINGCQNCPDGGPSTQCLYGSKKTKGLLRKVIDLIFGS